MVQGMSRDAWDEFSKTILVRYVLSYLCGTLYLDPYVSLKRIFASSVGGLLSLSTHASTCLRKPVNIKVEDNGAVVCVGCSLTVHNPLWTFH